jgi:peptidoglycan biosynthesis protein MviN/MurJ (putative lipid II flippase)
VLIFIASPVTTAIFPLMAEQKARGDEKELIKTFHQAIKVVTFLALPCAIFFAVESKDIVAILLQNGKFSPEDTVICANLITIIAIMIVPQSINLIMNNMFMVYKETKKLAVMTSCMTIFFIPLYYLLSDKYQIYGIALTYTLFYISIFISYSITLSLKHNDIFTLSGIWEGFKYCTLGGILFASIFWVHQSHTCANLSPLIRLLALGIFFLIIFITLSFILRINQLGFIISRLNSNKK